MLWGGTLMVAAVIMLLGYLGHRIRRSAAIVAGVGFGLFIDELGKFITSDNNYFFRPAIALIYAVFVLLFLWWRSLERRRAWTNEAYLANALMLLQDAAVHELDPAERFHLVHWLRASGAAGEALLGDVERVASELPQDRLTASPVQRRLRGIRKRVAASLHSPWAARLAIGVLCVRLLAALAAAAVLAGGGRLTLPDEPFGSPLILAVMLSILPALIGFVRLLRSWLGALRWFKRSVLVSIMLTDLFTFYYQQLGALSNLAIDLVLLAIFEALIDAQHRRALTRDAPVPAITPG